MTPTRSDLAEQLECLRVRAESCNSWLWDNWQQFGTDAYHRVEAEFNDLVNKMQRTRREIDRLDREAEHLLDMATVEGYAAPF